MTNVARIEAALRAEERKLDRANRGLHRFGPIHAGNSSDCNWTATFRAIGSITPLDELRSALERVQAKFPVADFK